ncbi:MAG: LON peptidase substrate-binding domain-containing protein, partial [Clostridia bacterium]|nr:LON peptidase substrate-binding domain-containing protein [Clostridia bacterium]
MANNQTFTELETVSLPLVALRGIVIFPGAPAKLELSSIEDLAAVSLAEKQENEALFIALRDPEQLPPYKVTDFFTVGCVAQIGEKELRPSAVRLTASGFCRARILSISEDFRSCTVLPLENENDLINSTSGAKLYKETLSLLDEFVKLLPTGTKELKDAILKSATPGDLADSIACTLLISFLHKQAVLEEADVKKRLQVLNSVMKEEIPLLKEDILVHTKVRAALEENQKEYYLKEQLRVIKEELGMDDEDEETNEYLAKISRAELPADIEGKL